eukprot:NODE_888_length_1146_cov_104.043756_g617_i0.p4 GENE.NODE_888_length_1146_cov_104.043756_g617_i0~~NODE_888_length_1146_cov_104.043756_g617_i0.p4  ORF type:complete len:87 (-),score=4.92 NODE_888_length_1146_cov_104.043756_g617_i0:61-321(-)
MGYRKQGVRHRMQDRGIIFFCYGVISSSFFLGGPFVFVSISPGPVKGSDRDRGGDAHTDRQDLRRAECCGPVSWHRPGSRGASSGV